MTPEPWGKMPCFWQSQPDAHARIATSDVGAAIAALKLYIAFCVKANFNRRRELAPGCVRLPVAQLSKIVGLSKPSTVRGLRELVKWGFVEPLGGRPAVYRLSNYEVDGAAWTKIPSAHLYDGHIAILRRIADLPNRGQARVHALQLYLYVASIRNKSSDKATVSYARVMAVLGISRNDVSRAISMVVADDLVSVRLADASDVASSARPSNEYWLRGTTPSHGIDTWRRLSRASDLVVVDATE